MAGKDADRSSARGTVVLVLLLALVAGGVAVVRYDLLDRLRDGSEPSAASSTEPAEVAPPPGVEVPEVAAPPAVAEVSAPATDVDATVVRRTLERYLRGRALGSHVLAEVAPLAGGAPIYTRGGRSDDTAIPASNTKVVTSAAALLALGPDHVFTTDVRRSGSRLTLVGGGDPFLERGPTKDGAPWPYPARADLEALAEQTATALAADGTRRVRLAYDDSLFSGPTTSPTWEPGYLGSEAAPTTALWVDRGKPEVGIGRVDDPSAEAARSFAAALTAAGVSVVGEPVVGRAASGAEQVAAVDSAPLAQIVERLLDVSDNDAAEVLLRHVGIAESGEGSIKAGRVGVRRLLQEQGVSLGKSVLHDGSGLSRDNRLDPSVLIGVLQLAASQDHPGLRSIITGLPIAGFTGSLTDRMDQGPDAGLGRVRAKTGTLTNVSTLAGIATDVDGNAMAFVLLVDRIPVDTTGIARIAIDNAAAALGACACSG